MIELREVAVDRIAATAGHRRLLTALLPRATRPGELARVLHDVDLDVAPGEALGVIGLNGAGKSTLLQVLAGILPPAAGSVVVRGEVASVLDLWSGFLPELTGRANVRLLGDLAGGPDRVEEIERFADLGAAFDAPVHTYSSGMFLRLAFATAIAGEPDVLLLDEVLAVGDAPFQQRCFARLRDLRTGGASIVLATHHLASLPATCDRVIVLDRGRIVFEGAPLDAIDHHHRIDHGVRDDVAAASAMGVRYGRGGARIDGIRCRSTELAAGQPIELSFDIVFDEDVPTPEIHVGLHSTEGLIVFGTTGRALGVPPAPAVAGEVRHLEVQIGTELGIRDLFVDVAVTDDADGAALDGVPAAAHVTIEPSGRSYGVADLPATMRVSAPAPAPASTSSGSAR